MSRIDGVSPTSMNQPPSNNNQGWKNMTNYLQQIRGELLDNPGNEHLDNQFVQMLNCAWMYTNASPSARTAWLQVMDALGTYSGDPSYANNQALGAAINNLQNNPPNCTNSQFAANTNALINEISGSLHSISQADLSSLIEGLNLLTNNSDQLHGGYSKQFGKVETALQTYMEQNPPTPGAIQNLETELQNLQNACRPKK